jgi:hypothetical protein
VKESDEVVRLYVARGGAMKQFFSAAVLTIVVLTGFGSSLAAANDEGLGMSRLRSGHVRIVEAFKVAYARSATFRALVDTMESSGDIVYLEAATPTSRQFRSSLRLASSKGGVRYLRIEIDVWQIQRVVVAQLAHELQHATEVVGRPDVVDAPSLIGLYKQIGFRSCQSGECWETSQAKAIERLVVEETERSGTTKAVAAHNDDPNLQPGVELKSR